MYVTLGLMAQPAYDSPSPDMLDSLWEHGQIYWSTVIRLVEGKPYYLYTEKGIDSAINYVNPPGREAYYKTVQQRLPPGELEAHLTLWQLPELQKQQAADGGMYTVVTCTEDTPTPQHPAYTLSVKRLYSGRIARVLALPMYITIDTARRRITMCNEDGRCLSLRQWRRKGSNADWHYLSKYVGHCRWTGP